MPGLWHDMMLEDGGFRREAAPASSLYHIICAIGELSRYLANPQTVAANNDVPVSFPANSPVLELTA
ncbi:hypothetical protein N7E02_11590 [Aliirhizobium terrae]|uniref:hypothetical protein n=1 Tax=Terrirhizobium terrae TaxID=2926709 RepID=UPI0025771B0A|nr:hypothetical protein [Rhizobium sp. CC-CFT758]WJH41115.1 hypothetical protein N7E02_11590 [Rhizobium sp. CC-CFT758]